MEPWVLLLIGVIIAATVYAAWKQFSFSIIASAVCVFTFIVMSLVGQNNWFTAEDQIAFSPVDLGDPARIYTLLTSMFAHANLLHLLFNILGLIFIGMVFEQRVGSRSFILLFFLSGLAGTLVFAGLHWNDSLILVLGASGAISGVLGAFARLYPNEKMSMFIFFVPLPPMPIWIIVGLFVLIQLFLIPTSSQIAYESHLGGLAAGILLAPILVKLPLHKGVRRTISLQALRRLATTPALKSMLKRIEEESVPDVRNAWIEHFLSEARCPHCGAPLRVTKGELACEKGHLL
ncbi:MAG: rhomboid family intramembrane serine protease [Thermoplasmata archaeon]